MAQLSKAFESLVSLFLCDTQRSPDSIIPQMNRHTSIIRLDGLGGRLRFVYLLQRVALGINVNAIRTQA
jgi:hypothetical protein